MLRGVCVPARHCRAFSTDTSLAYRELLKAQRQLFVADRKARVAARLETRTQFVQNAEAPASSVPGMVQDARDAAAFLRHNVAQTVRNDKGNFGALAFRPACPRATALSLLYVLTLPPCPFLAHAELTPRPEHLRRGSTPAPLPDGLDGTPCSRS
jgi:hypothetical protein